MAVVFSHTGSPRNKTTAQKETIDHRRSHRLSVVSGGGFFRAFAASAGAAGGEGDGCLGSAVSDASVSVAAAMLRWGCRVLLWTMSRHDARPCASTRPRVLLYHYSHYSPASLRRYTRMVLYSYEAMSMFLVNPLFRLTWTSVHVETRLFQASWARVYMATRPYNLSSPYA